MCQLGVTVAFIALFLFHAPMKEWTRKNPGFFIGAFVLTFVLLIAMACCESVRRKAPGNYICLGLFTIAEGFVLGAAASTYKLVLSSMS
jgi:FtsH-binding integral membrane protein